MISIGAIVDGGFRLIRERPMAVLAWATVYLGLTVATALALGPVMGEIMTLGASPDPERLLSLMGPFYLLNLCFLLVYLIVWTAAYRAVLRPEQGGLAYLRLGMDELRMLGLAIVVFVVLLVANLALALVLGVVVAGVAVASGEPGLAALVTVVGAILYLGVSIFLYIRLSLAFPLTLYRQRIVIGEAWTLSRGHFWTLFLAYLIVTLIALAVMMLVGVITSGSYFTEILSAGNDPAAMQAAMEAQMQRQFGSPDPLTILGWVASAAGSALWVTLGAGAVGTAAKLLVADDFDDIESVLG